MANLEVDPSAARVLEPALAPGDKLLWATHPHRGKIGPVTALLTLLAFAVYGCFAYFLFLLAYHYALTLWGIPIAVLLSGLAIWAVARFFVGPLVGPKAFAFGATERHIIVARSIPRHVWDVIPFHEMSAEWVRHGAGRGRVQFGPRVAVGGQNPPHNPFGRFGTAGNGLKRPKHQLPPAINNVANVEDVRAFILQRIASATPPPIEQKPPPRKKYPVHGTRSG